GRVLPPPIIERKFCFTSNQRRSSLHSPALLLLLRRSSLFHWPVSKPSLMETRPIRCPVVSVNLTCISNPPRTTRTATCCPALQSHNARSKSKELATVALPTPRITSPFFRPAAAELS